MAMVLQMSDSLIAFALENPTQNIVLSVPDTLQDGGNYFFIREDYTAGEHSQEKIYIPIQRPGLLRGRSRRSKHQSP